MPERTLKVTVIGDTKQLQNALGGADKALQTSTHFTTNYGGALTKLEANYAKQQLGLTETTARSRGAGEAMSFLSKHAQNMPPILGQAAQSLQGVASSAGLAGGGMASMGLVVPGALAAIAGGAMVAVKSFQSLAEQVLAYQRVTGASAEESSRMVEVANDLGVSSETLGKAMFRLSKNVSGVTPASEKSAKSLESLGVTIDHNSDGTVNLTKTLENASQALVNSDDAATRDAIAFAAFGKSGAQLIPILEQGAAGLQQMADATNNVFTQKQLEDARNYAIATNQLGKSFGSLQVSVGSQLVPALTSLTDAGEYYAEQAKHNTKSTESFGDKVKDVATDAIPVVGPLLVGLGHQHDSVAYKARQAGNAHEAYAKNLKDATEAIKAEADAELKLYDTIHAGIDAQFALTHADLAVSEAAGNVASAEKNVKDATDQHGASSQEATAATLAYQEAIENQKEAMVRDADATVNLAEKQAEEAGGSLNASQKADIFRAKLEELAQKAGPGSALYNAIEGYIAQLDRIPARKSTELDVVITGTSAHVSGESGEITAYDTGGTVPGPVGSPHLAVVHGGEEVLTPEQQAARAGGGSGSGVRDVHVHIHGGIFMDDGPSMDRLSNAIARRLSYVTGR